MALPSDDPEDCSPYSVDRLRMLFRLYPYMGDSSLPDPELLALSHRLGYRSWPTDAMCERGDLARALKWLGERDERAELAIRLYYCVDMPLDEVAKALHCSISTVKRWREDGLELMSWYLTDNPFAPH